MGDETKVEIRQVKEGVQAAGNILERYLIRILGPLGARISERSPLGRVMAFSGLLVAAVSLVLILTISTSFSTHSRRGHKYTNITYEQKGYGIAFLCGAGLFVAGMFLRDQQKGKKK